MNDVDEIKSRVNIVDIVSQYVAELKNKGGNYFGLCPFHNEKTPSFSINENLQIYKCFGCGEGGDVFNFIMKAENMDFREALEHLAEKINYKLTSQKQEKHTKLYHINEKAYEYFKKNLTPNSPGVNYIKDRKINKRSIIKFGLGYAPADRFGLMKYLNIHPDNKTITSKSGLFGLKDDGTYYDKFRNRLIFSIYDIKGRIVGFSGRTIPGQNTISHNYTPPKYLNSPETEVFKKNTLLFGLYQAKREIQRKKTVIITEGQINVISSHQAGIENIVASLGTSLTENHIKILKRYAEKVYLAFDTDEAGKKALIRATKICINNDLDTYVVKWSKEFGKDPDEVINKSSEEWYKAIKNPIDAIEFITNSFLKKHPNYNARILNKFALLIKEIINTSPNEVKKDYFRQKVSGKLNLSKDSLKNNEKSEVKSDHIVRKPTQAQVTEGDSNTILIPLINLIINNWNESKTLLQKENIDYIPDSKYKEVIQKLQNNTHQSNINDILSNRLNFKTKEIIERIAFYESKIDTSIPVNQHYNTMIFEIKKSFIKKRLSKEPWNTRLLKELKNLHKSN